MTAEQTTTPAGEATCWCCGLERPAGELVRLQCHDEIGLCGVCIGWLGERRNERMAVRDVAPILATSDVRRALAHYAALGFDVEEWEGGGYGFMERDGTQLHIGEPEGFDPATNTVSIYLDVRDADALHAEWSTAGEAGEFIAPFDTDYGMREGSHTDPDGNVLRFGAPLSSSC